MADEVWFLNWILIFDTFFLNGSFDSFNNTILTFKFSFLLNKLSYRPKLFYSSILSEQFSNERFTSFFSIFVTISRCTSIKYFKNPFRSSSFSLGCKCCNCSSYLRRQIVGLNNFFFFFRNSNIVSRLSSESLTMAYIANKAFTFYLSPLVLFLKTTYFFSLYICLFKTFS